MRISAAIITLDEERNIGRCLASLRGVADEIVVLDSGSKDATEALCRDAGARFERQPWLGYGPQKNAAVERASHAWVLSLDADEALSPELRAAILMVRAKGPDADAYAMNRRNHYLGRAIKHGGWYPDRKIRLWRKDAGRWSDATVHEVVEVGPAARVDRLAGDILHWSVEDRGAYMRKLASFQALAAESMHRRGARSSTLHCLGAPAMRFIRNYVLQRGFLDGRVGFDLARIAAANVRLRYQTLAALEAQARLPARPSGDTAAEREADAAAAKRRPAA